MLDEILARWKSSTTLALNTVARVEDEFKAQTEKVGKLEAELATTAAQLAAAQLELEQLKVKSEAQDGVLELRQAVREGMQSDRVKCVLAFPVRVPRLPAHNTISSILRVVVRCIWQLPSLSRDRLPLRCSFGAGDSLIAWKQTPQPHPVCARRLYLRHWSWRWSLR